ncbi:hypothetical protein BDF20DRAFT_140950 [Mycotypha africana]|uniref:uncharacterized protein n=1 Tax=Mycotypha africana TaxID=64632 RepID=UPI002301C826|nr:uncharacterized protein BDF20DRAFT_140950 [Mycotypha africana]KAI8969023.1 hypothetical protein BDF20DRAFT_140950 [Mycotypha africana]
MSTYPLFYLRFLKPPPTDCYVGQHFTIVWTIENDLGDQTYLEPVTVNLSLHTSRVSPGNDDQQLGLRLLNSNESTRTKRKKASPYPPHDKLSSTTATAAKRDITTIFDPFRGGGMVTKLVVEELPLNISHKKEPLPLGTKVAVQLSMALSNLDTNSSHKVWQGAYPLHSNIWIIPAWSIPITATVVKQRHEKAAKSGNQAERVLCIPCDPHRQQLVRIREDAVQSIARHVWDCGMGMCYFLSEYKLDMDNITILELGKDTGKNTCPSHIWKLPFC